MMEAAAPSLTRHRFFLKHTDYQEQSEYRLLWTLDNANDPNELITQ
jgi:hypothetical protein